MWFRFASFSVWRNYLLFGLMAGVRSNVTLFEPKGLPVDLSHDLQSIKNDDWFHNHSFLYIHEVALVLHEYKKHDSSGLLELRAIFQTMKLIEKKHESRLVFWFDS